MAFRLHNYYFARMADQLRILVVRFSSIGDIILTTPVYRLLKKQLGAEVHLLTKRSFAFAVEGNPYIDKVHLIDSDVSEVKLDLQAAGFDHVVDLHNNIRSMQVKRMLKVPTTTMRKLNFEKWLLVNLKMDRMPEDPHVIRRYIAAAEPLGVTYDGEGMDFVIPEHAEVDLSQLTTVDLDKLGFVALTIATSTPTRSMEPWQLEQLIQQIEGPVVLLGGPSEAEVGESLQEGSTNTVNMAGKLSLQQSASVIRQSRLLITPDTSLMHIGAALDHPMITVWGNTNERFGMTPFYCEDSSAEWHMIEVDGLKCRPCSKIGHNQCPKGHFKCIRDLDLDKMAVLANGM